jgi:uncharacterized protein (DUF2236 family)
MRFADLFADAARGPQAARRPEGTTMSSSHLDTGPRSPSDAGASVSWRINAERLMLLAWSRAILLQFAHPLIAAGVHDHSTFRQSAVAPLVRLHHTVRAMVSLTFGDDVRREETLERIRSIHRRVNGRLADSVGPFPAGTPYSAEDPALVLWVHATLLDSIVPLYDALVAPLGDDARDAYCAESAAVAIALGAIEADTPRRWRDLRAYMERMLRSPEITVGPQARALAAAVLAPPIRALLWPGLTVNRLVAVGTLPARVRDEYGFAWTPREARRLARVTAAVRASRRVPLSLVWQWPEARRRSPRAAPRRHRRTPLPTGR